MDLRIFIEPQQGASYEDQLRVAQRAEQTGFDAFFRSDHFLNMGQGDPLPGPTDSWVTLAGIARETSRIRLGTLVTSATFRHPSLLAIQVAQVDAMSSGRVELGIGAGWFEQEHTAYGFEFPNHRFSRLTEQLEVITGLWSTPIGEAFSYSGEHYALADSPALPKPHGPAVPIIIGGNGPRRTPALAARFASEYNAGFPEIEDIPQRFSAVRRACEEIGRNPADLTYSVALVMAVGEGEAEFARRAAAIGRDVAELREHGVAGTVNEAIGRLQALREVGVERVYLQALDLTDLDQLDLVAAEVMPHVSQT